MRPPPNHINQVWVGDITYVPLAKQRIPLFGRGFGPFFQTYRWLGHAKPHARIVGVGRAANGLVASKNQAGLIHHSDRGGQYAGTRYRDRLAKVGMLQSMSRADNCYDNAFMESSFGTMKTELEMKVYENEAIARKEIPCLHPILQCTAASFFVGLSQP